MQETRDHYQPSAGLGYVVAGVALFVVGGLLLANAEEPRNVFLTGGLACLGAGFYLLLAGAVARGVQVARHWMGS